MHVCPLRGGKVSRTCVHCSLCGSADTPKAGYSHSFPWRLGLTGVQALAAGRTVIRWLRLGSVRPELLPLLIKLGLWWFNFVLCQMFWHRMGTPRVSGKSIPAWEVPQLVKSCPGVMCLR